MSEWFEEIQEDIIPDQFWEEISSFNRIIILVSGGVDSTIIVHEFHKRKINVELLWNNTMRSMPGSRDILAKIFRFTGYRFHIVYPHHNQKEISRKTHDKVDELYSIFLKTGNWNHYRRNDIPCCYYLKKAPAKKWYKDNVDCYETIIVTGIAGYEGHRRQQRLGELRKKGTFLGFLKTYNNWFGYPFRDYKSRKFDRPFLEAYIRTTQYPERCLDEVKKMEVEVEKEVKQEEKKIIEVTDKEANELITKNKKSIQFIGEFIKRFDTDKDKIEFRGEPNPAILSLDRFIGIVKRKSIDEKFNMVSSYSLKQLYAICLFFRQQGYNLSDVELITPDKNVPAILRVDSELLPFDLMLAPNSFDWED
jgi:hypothetical protein